MESYIVFALFGAVFAGLYSFCLKIVAERGYDTYMVTFYDYMVGGIISGLYLIYYLSHTSISLSDTIFITFLAAINVTLFSLSILSRVEGMRHIDTVIFFPLYKTFGPIMITFVSIFWFSESLTSKEVLGIIAGILVPLMLITKTENRIQKNLFLGIILVIVTSLLTMVTSIAIKEVMVRELSVELFVFMCFLIGAVISLLGHWIHKKKSKKLYQTQGILKFSIITGVIHLCAFVFFALSVAGNLAVVFTINSFSILVPIILSIIFYGEHFNFKKGFVIALSIVSILLFI